MMSRAPGWFWSSFSGSAQPSAETAVRITSMGCEAGGSASSVCFSDAGRPRSERSFAL